MLHILRELNATGLAVVLLAGAVSAQEIELRESITVPCDGTTVTSGAVLEAGIVYVVRASGTCQIGGPLGIADAEYAFDAQATQRQDRCTDFPSQGDDVDLGIAIDDPLGGSLHAPSKFPAWGPFDATHEYSIELTGAGARIVLDYHDCEYADNGGALTVEIFAPVPETPCQGLAGIAHARCRIESVLSAPLCADPVRPPLERAFRGKLGATDRLLGRALDVGDRKRDRLLAKARKKLDAVAHRAEGARNRRLSTACADSLLALVAEAEMDL